MESQFDVKNDVDWVKQIQKKPCHQKKNNFLYDLMLLLRITILRNKRFKEIFRILQHAIQSF